MKKINDIENLEIEALEAAAIQESVPVPEGMKGRIEEALAAKTVADSAVPEHDPEEKRPAFKPYGKKLMRWIPYVGIAAAIIVVVLAINKKDSEPLDTCDDPAVAYAQVEEIFKQISDNMARGMDMTSNNKE